jgi:hypothetical protein
MLGHGSKCYTATCRSGSGRQPAAGGGLLAQIVGYLISRSAFHYWTDKAGRPRLALAISAA